MLKRSSLCLSGFSNVQKGEFGVLAVKLRSPRIGASPVVVFPVYLAAGGIGEDPAFLKPLKSLPLFLSAGTLMGDRVVSSEGPSREAWALAQRESGLRAGSGPPRVYSSLMRRQLSSPQGS